MPEYLVTWKIELEADDPAEAAVQAQAIQWDRDESLATFFTVKDRATGAEVNVEVVGDDE